MGVVSLNLPQIGILADGDEKNSSRSSTNAWNFAKKHFSFALNC